MAFIDPDESSGGFIDPDDSGPQGSGEDKLYAKYSKDYDSRWNKTQIPGTQTPRKLSRKEYFEDQKDRVTDTILGIPDSLLSIATSVPATIQAVPKALYTSATKGAKVGEAEFNRLVEQSTWTPRTDTGEKIVEQAGGVLQAFGPNPYTPSMRMRGAKPIPREVTPTASIIADIAKERQAAEAAPVTPTSDVMRVTPDGQAYDPAVEPFRQQALAKQMEESQGQRAFQSIVDEQLNGWNEPIPQDRTRSAMGDIAAQLEQERFKQAQEVLNQRQQAMEQEVAQSASLDFNAAERARQENAPTGFAENQQALRESANTRRPGDNTPMDFENPYPVDAEQYPNVLKDAPYQYEGGIDPTGYIAEQTGMPIAVRDMLGYSTTPDPFNRYSPQQAANRILRDGEKPAIIKQGVGGKQAGVINVKAISDALTKIKFNQIPMRDLYLAFDGAFNPYAMENSWANSVDPKSRERLVWMSPDDFHRAAMERDDWYKKSPGANARRESVRDALKKSDDGLHQIPWLTIDEGMVRGHEGRHRMDVFREMNIPLVPVLLRDSKHRNERGPFSEATPTLLSENGEVIPTPKEIFELPKDWIRKDELGGINLKEIGDGLRSIRRRFGDVTDSVRTPVSQEMIDRKQIEVRKAKAVGEILGSKLPEWTDPTTFEEAVALAKEAKDINSNRVGQGVAPGLNFMATHHNNPVLKFARKLFADARGEMTTNSKNWITAPETGHTARLRKLSADDKVRVNEVITELDKHQLAFDPTIAERLGLSPEATAFLEQRQKVNDFVWERRQAVAGEQGVQTAHKRSGYAASLFGGDYRSLVTDAEGKPIGFISADSPGEFQLAKKFYEEKHHGSKFSANDWREARKRVGGNYGGQFKYQGLNEVLRLLAQADGDFSKANAEMAQAITKASVELFGKNVHDMQKKGITGNQGNKPWLSPEKNSQQRLDAEVKHFEDMFEYLALQKPLEELRLLMADDSTAHLVKTKQYMEDYIANVTGRYVHPAGKIVNEAFNAGHYLLEEVASHIPGAKNVVGPGNTLKMANTLKNKMAQYYMGWFNYMFTISQLAQPVQTGMPMLHLVANRLGENPAAAMASLTRGGAQYMQALAYKLGVLDNLDATTKRALEWGEERGILDFSEIERAYEGHKTKVGVAIDRVAEFSMQVGEQATRPPMFLAFVDMLRRKEPDIEKVLPMAEHLTNQTMADYHRWERPSMYSGFGVLGQHIGGLTTFKHNFTSTQVLAAREAARPGAGSKLPIIMSLMTMAAFAGVMGVPFYDDINKLVYEPLRKKITGEQRSIAQDALAELPQWMKTGVVSSILDLNMQGKFSSANMIPDSFAQAAFPHLSGAGQIVGDAYKAVNDPNETNMSNLAVSATPSGWRQATQNLVNNDDGWTVDRYGKRDSFRTEEEWKRSAITGLVPLDEAVNKQERFQNRSNYMAGQEKLKGVATKFKEAVIAGEPEARLAELLNEYQEAGGNGAELVKQIPLIQRDAQMSGDQRARGIPKSPAGIKRYEAYDN